MAITVEQIEEWAEPPSVTMQDNYSQNRYADVAAQLQSHQGVWAKLAPRGSVQQAKSLASNIRNGKLASFSPSGAFEVVRKDNDIWVRYIGEPVERPERPKRRTWERPTDPKIARAVRTWAKATGRPISDRGRIKEDLIAEWRAATKGEL